LNRALGSLYYVELDNKITRGLLVNCLSYPSDLIYDNSNQILYVAETFSNRIIRLIQSPPGSYHSSIFHQFNGRVGPTAITMDELGNIYVARYEFQVINPFLNNKYLFFYFNSITVNNKLNLGYFDENSLKNFFNLFQLNKKNKKSSENDVDGVISLLNKEGNLVGELIIPKMPEITGIFISSKNKDFLYFTEKNYNGVMRIKLSSFISEITKLEDNNKII